MSAREQAVKVMRDVLSEQGSFASKLPYYSAQLQNVSQRALFQELCYGCARFYPQLAFLASKLLKRAFNKKDYDVYSVVLLGLYQLLYMNIPQYAIVSETVETGRKLKKKWAIALVNGVLRNFLRRRDELLEEVEKESVAKYAHPQWLLSKIKTSWPKEWKSIIDINNQYPLMRLRVNTNRITREDYLEKLAIEKIEATQSIVSEVGLILKMPCPVERLPGFNEGDISVQDCGAQLAAKWLDLEKGQRVLDACAAPGGKTTHILEYELELKEVVAVDLNEARLNKVRANLERLQLNAKTECCDLEELPNIEEMGVFDRILLDVPCSGSGVISRHPDIKIVRREEDTAKFAEQQLKLLHAVWKVLKPGGKLLYVTCSIFSEENENIIGKFLSKQDGAQEEKIETNIGKEREFGRQLLPTLREHDGFYYARLEKRS